MTISKLDEICPPTVGDQLIKLQLTTPDIALQAFTPFEVNINYSGAYPVGVSLPIEVMIRGPVPGQFRSRIFRKALPPSAVVKPFGGGRHFVLVRELYHNRWQGQLFVDVLGPDQKFSRG